MQGSNDRHFAGIDHRQGGVATLACQRQPAAAFTQQPGHPETRARTNHRDRSIGEWRSTAHLKAL